MNKYNVLEYSIIFYDQRNKELANVRYSLVFFPVSGGKETFTHVTNEKGRTKPIRLNQNGKLHIFVEGHETIFSPRKIIKPVLAEDDSVIEINEPKLAQNSAFITQQQYELQQNSLQNLKQRTSVTKNKAGGFLNSSKIKPAMMLDLKKKLKDNQAMSYEIYKEKIPFLLRKLST